MAETVQEVNIKVSALDNFTKSAKEIESKAERLGSKFNKVGDTMTGIGKKMTLGFTLPIVAGFGFAVKSASDLNETINKVDVSFGDSSKVVKDWAKTSVKSMGLAQQSALDATALFGDMATSMGINQVEASKMSMNLTQLGADLASFKNISFEQAQTALASVFTGETESLKRLGIVMTQTNLDAFALSKGIGKTTREMSQAELVNLRYAYVMEQTKNAQGDFARTADGTANRMRMAGEQIKELSAKIGLLLLPYINKILEKFSEWIRKITELSPKTQTIIVVIAGILAVLGPLLIILGSIVGAIGSLIPVLASPVFWIFLAIAVALAGVAYLIYRNWESIKPVVDRVVASLVVAYEWFSTNIMPILQMVARVIADQLIVAWQQLKIAWDTFIKAITPYMPQLMLLGKILLGISLVIIGSVVVALVTMAVILAYVARAIATLINWISSAIAWFNRMNSAVWGAMRGIHSAVTGALAGAGQWLENAGRSIIDGLVRGINGAIGKVKSALSKVTNMIPSWKGPPARDKVLLRDSGEMIMQGLNKGINNGALAVKKTLTGITTDIAPTVNIGANAGNLAQQPSGQIHNGDIIINDRQDAQAIMQILGRQQELSNYGLAR